MTKTRTQQKYSEEKILEILNLIEGGKSVSEVGRTYGISTKTIYFWRNKYSGMQPDEMKRLKYLEDENARLKKLVADMALDNAMLKDALGKRPKAERSSASRW
ncbi:transposase (plasmid) [Deinococcus peraridilitoris DSM 19664]|uniref:Transposase n=1 Tax=Deinococcus peraridilitoris (strain DSM 19664 / LMG 22246 / CIP 109416 / KR-200) TaxID=937777 RepID=L0A735_DEIPD|nr:transposase [Deinococcus peraridilitoris DSM 19664]